MVVREPEPSEGERIRELVDSSITTSFRLSPRQIEAISREQFDQDALERKLDSPETVVRVGETDEDVDGSVVVGVVEGTLDDQWGEVSWLFVDPEHRGRGIGTRLFETATATLQEEGAEGIRATVLEANTEGHQFVEQFGLEHVDERRVEIGDESLVKYVYADPATDAGTAADAAEAEAVDEAELPGVELRDGTETATTEDGERVFLDLDGEISGTAAPFFAAYTDEERADRFGYYCSNCGSLQASMDNMDRIECGNCGNTSASRGSASYDDSYL